MTYVPLEVHPELDILPLNIRRAWLISLMAKNIKNSSISLFIQYFLPLSIKIHGRIGDMDIMRRKLYSNIEHKFWELLPRILQSPNDFEENFPKLAPIIGSALMERADLRLILLASIRSTISFVERPDSPMEQTQIVQCYAKNYFPILFNLYTDTSSTKNEQEAKSVKAATLETIRRYTCHCPPELLLQYAESALSKLIDNATEMGKKVLRITRLIIINFRIEFLT